MTKRFVSVVVAVFLFSLVVPAAHAGLFAANFIAVGGRLANGTGTVRLFTDPDQDHGYSNLAGEISPFTGKVRDALRVATGDFDNDGNAELVAGTSTRGEVAVIDVNPDGTPGAVIERIATGFHGTFVAAGDINGDGVDDLVIGEQRGGRVAIYADDDRDGLLGDDRTDLFSPFAGFKGSVRVAAGDTQSLKGQEVIVAPGPGPVTTVAVYSDFDLDGGVSDNPKVEEFQPFGPKFTSGAFVASGPTQIPGATGIVIAPQKKGASVLVFEDTDASGRAFDEPAKDSLVPDARASSRIAVGDLDNSGTFVELIAAPASRAGHFPVTTRDDNGLEPRIFSSGTAFPSFVAMPPNTKTGAYVAFGKITNETYAYKGRPASIPDSGAFGDPLETFVDVPPAAGSIGRLEVSLELTHTFDADLVVTLQHLTTGTSVTLMSGCGHNDDGFLVRLSDLAATDICSVADQTPDKPVEGIFNPDGTELLSAFDNEDASGRWKLTVNDQSSPDTGTLFAWALHVFY